ncbi:hypothetical protein ES702_03414 [subsurface metagenome]
MEVNCPGTKYVLCFWYRVSMLAFWLSRIHRILHHSQREMLREVTLALREVVSAGIDVQIDMRRLILFDLRHVRIVEVTRP